MTVLTVDHLFNAALPAAADYEIAERDLSIALDPAMNYTLAQQDAERRTTKRRACELAIAIDGLTDRASIDLGISKSLVRRQIIPLCTWPGGASRDGCLERIRGAANAYKHFNLSDPSLPIKSNNDILVVGAGWGVDGWGVGKHDGEQVLIRDKASDLWIFSGDVPVALHGWFRYLVAQQAALPSTPVTSFNVEVYP